MKEGAGFQPARFTKACLAGRSDHEGLAIVVFKHVQHSFFLLRVRRAGNAHSGSGILGSDAFLAGRRRQEIVSRSTSGPAAARAFVLTKLLSSIGNLPEHDRETASILLRSSWQAQSDDCVAAVDDRSIIFHAAKSVDDIAGLRNLLGRREVKLARVEEPPFRPGDMEKLLLLLVKRIKSLPMEERYQAIKCLEESLNLLPSDGDARLRSDLRSESSDQYFLVATTLDNASSPDDLSFMVRWDTRDSRLEPLFSRALKAALRLVPKMSDAMRHHVVDMADNLALTAKLPGTLKLIVDVQRAFSS
jgi:hypothetical protein